MTYRQSLLARLQYVHEALFMNGCIEIEIVKNAQSINITKVHLEYWIAMLKVNKDVKARYVGLSEFLKDVNIIWKEKCTAKK